MVLSVSTSKPVKSIKSLQHHDYYNTLSMPCFSEYVTDDENDSVSSTITRVASHSKILLNYATDNNKVKKSVRFTDVMELIPSVTPEPTDDERRRTWYTGTELQLMKKHTREYAKFVRTIDATTMSDLLNDCSIDFDDETSNDDIICLRGLEKHIKLPETAWFSSSSHRRKLIRSVLLEQRRQRREKLRDDCEDIVADDEYITTSNCEKICDVSMTYSEYCRDYARLIARKSYYIPAFAM